MVIIGQHHMESNHLATCSSFPIYKHYNPWPKSLIKSTTHTTTMLQGSACTPNSSSNIILTYKMGKDWDYWQLMAFPQAHNQLTKYTSVNYIKRKTQIPYPAYSICMWNCFKSCIWQIQNFVMCRYAHEWIFAYRRLPSSLEAARLTL